MDGDAMRRLGYRAVDALVERLEDLRSAPPWRGAAPGELDGLAGPPPEEGADALEVMEEALRDVLPVSGRIDHPRFFAFVPSSPTWPSVLGDFLAAGYNVFQGTWLESAGPSRLELVVLDWFRSWVGYPEGAGGLLTSGGSAANLCALVAAREAAGNPPDPVVYMSDQAHSSLERAARIAGVRPEGIRLLPTDVDAYRLRPDALADALAADREAGRAPICVCASAGATNTGAVDPLRDVASICRDAGVRLHVDAAYGGFAVLTERGRRLLDGLEGADSITLDPHKWLFQPYEAGCLLVRDTAALEDAFRILPEYLQDAGTGGGRVNFADRGLQLTRAFRALKVWMSVRTFGVAAFRAAIDGALDLAERAARRIEASDVLEPLAPPGLGIVCFRFAAAREGADLDALNARIQERIVEEGTAMMSSTRLDGRYALRLCVLNFRSTAADVDAVLDRVEELGREMQQA